MVCTIYTWFVQDGEVVMLSERLAAKAALPQALDATRQAVLLDTVGTDTADTDTADTETVVKETYVHDDRVCIGAATTQGGAHDNDGDGVVGTAALTTGTKRQGGECGINSSDSKEPSSKVCVCVCVGIHATLPTITMPMCMTA